MNKDELIEKLTPIVATYTQNKEALETINEDTDFINDLKINSANLVDVKVCAFSETLSALKLMIPRVKR
mgnify:CR=1 FL=1